MMATFAKLSDSYKPWNLYTSLLTSKNPSSLPPPPLFIPPLYTSPSLPHPLLIPTLLSLAITSISHNIQKPFPYLSSFYHLHTPKL